MVLPCDMVCPKEGVSLSPLLLRPVASFIVNRKNDVKNALINGQIKVWDLVGEDHSSQDLAADKRAAIQRRLREEDEANDDGK